MIPSSRLEPTSLNKGRPVVLDEPGSEVSQSIRSLARRFTGGIEAEGAAVSAPAADGKHKKKGLFGRRSKS